MIAYNFPDQLIKCSVYVLVAVLSQTALGTQWACHEQRDRWRAMWEVTVTEISSDGQRPPATAHTHDPGSGPLGSGKPQDGSLGSCLYTTLWAVPLQTWNHPAMLHPDSQPSVLWDKKHMLTLTVMFLIFFFYISINVSIEFSIHWETRSFLLHFSLLMEFWNTFSVDWLLVFFVHTFFSFSVLACPKMLIYFLHNKPPILEYSSTWNDENYTWKKLFQNFPTFKNKGWSHLKQLSC